MWLRGAKQQPAVWASLFLEDPGLCGNDMQRPSVDVTNEGGQRDFIQKNKIMSFRSS